MIGPQTEDLLKESDLLGKNAEVVYSADNVNQWDIETERIEADLVVIECTTVFPETVNIIKEKTRAVGASMAIVIYHYTQQAARGMMARARLLTPLRAPITNEDLKYVCEADLAMATIRNSSLEMMEYDDEESSKKLENLLRCQSGNTTMPFLIDWLRFLRVLTVNAHITWRHF